MDDKETYGVVVEAKTNLFKKAIQELSGMIRKFGKVAEEETTVTPKIDNNKFTSQIDNVKKRMKLLKKEMNEAINTREETSLESFFKHRIEAEKKYLDLLNRNAKIFGSNTIAGYGGEEGKTYNEIINEVTDTLEKYDKQVADVQKRENNKVIQGKIIEYEGLKNVLDDLIIKEKQYNLEQEKRAKEEKEFKEQINTTNFSIRNALDGGIKKIKRFTYYLLGARSVFSLFMKYQSIYYQYNEKMQYQSELSQNAIALSLAPAFELLGNVITYVSIGFAKFIEMLTGVNVLSKVTTKGIRDYNKSLKETQTLVSGIDEITNLTTPNNLGLAGQYQALEDFRKKVAEVEKWWNKFKLDLKDYFDIGKGWDIFVDTFPKRLKNLYNLTINSWLTPFVNRMKEELRPIWEPLVPGFEVAINNIKLKWNDFISFIKPKLVDPFIESIKSLKNKILSTLAPLFNQVIDWINKTFGVFGVHIEYIKTEEQLKIIEATNDLIDNINNIIAQNNIDESDKSKIKNLISNAQETMNTDGVDLRENLVNLMNDLLETIDTNVDKGTKNAVNTALDNISQLDIGIKKEVEKINEMSNSLKTQFINLSLKFNIDKSSVLSIANKVRNLSSILGVPTSIFDNMSSKILKNFGYAKGLDYVPYDNYPALLHKGEAVVPAKYNPTIHSEGNEYTNSLLETVVMKLDDLSRKPTILNIDGQQFANATYELYEEARNNQNYVEGVVR